MTETKHLRKKSIDLMDFPKLRTVTSVRAYARIRSFHSIIQSGRYDCQCAAFPGIRLVAKTKKGVFVSVVKNVWTATNPVSIKTTSSNTLTSLRYFDLKGHQPLHY
jgi:hypothetical protein